LRGAKILLLAAGDGDLPPIEHLNLASDPGFQDAFMDCIGFPQKERHSE
jgi:hypothetical protein